MTVVDTLALAFQEACLCVYGLLKQMKVKGALALAVRELCVSSLIRSSASVPIYSMPKGTSVHLYSFLFSQPVYMLIESQAHVNTVDIKN